MRKQSFERYQRVLTRILRETSLPAAANEELSVRPDLDEEAALNHLRYVQRFDEQVRWATFDAARRALDRIGTGDYGLCIDCGEPIHPKRLEAVPWAERCVHCQSEWEGLEAEAA